MSWFDRLLRLPAPDAPQQPTTLAVALPGGTVLQEAATLQDGVVQLREGVFDGMYADPDINLTAAQGGSQHFRRITKSPRDLNTVTHERSVELAFFLYDSNPLAKRILELTRDFVCGDGISVQCQDESKPRRDEQQEVVDRFWNDPVNRMDLKLPDKVNELGLFGEQCYTVAVNERDGSVQLGYVDPGSILDVLVDHDNAEIPVAVVLKGQPPQRLKVVQFDSDLASKTYGRLVGLKDGDGFTDGGEKRKYSGACFLFQINKVSSARRGRSDLLSLADWIDAEDQIQFNEVDRALLLKSFIWHVTLMGATDDQVKKRAAEIHEPKPGSTRVTNEKETWEPLAPTLNAADTAVSADMLLSKIATGAGLPKTWLNGLMDVNRATASEMGEFGYAKLVRRQKYVRYMVEQMVTFVLDAAEMKGRIKRRPKAKGSTKPAAWVFSVNVPEMRAKDMSSAATTFQTVVTACSLAMQDGLMDKQVAQDLIVLILGQLGVDVDLDEMRSRLDAAEEAMADMPPAVPDDGTGDNPTPLRPGVTRGEAA